MVGFGLNGPLRQYLSQYRAVSQRERERIDESKNVQTTPPAPTASAVGPCPTVIQIVGRFGTGSLPSTIAPPDHPEVPLEGIFEDNFFLTCDITYYQSSFLLYFSILRRITTFRNVIRCFSRWQISDVTSEIYSSDIIFNVECELSRHMGKTEFFNTATNSANSVS